MSDIIVYGRGKTGQSIMQMLQKLHKSAVFYDDVNGFDGKGDFTSKSVVLLSPGVPPSARGLTKARSVVAKVVSELEFCFPLCKGKTISVTGTNGKTTTCEMIYHILRQSGAKTRLLGNGGVPFSSQVLDVAENETVVLESSSFQLAQCKGFSPFVSVFTNLAPDHLFWHGSYEAYRQAKQNNFLFQQNGFALFNLDDPEVTALSQKCGCRSLFYSTGRQANCYFDGKRVVLRDEKRQAAIEAPHFAEFAPHNQSNALAAVLACCCVGVSPSKAVESLRSFRTPPHRLQTVDNIDGVTFVDDSKATNVHATVSALKCFEKELALILGGSDKGEDYGNIFGTLPHNVKFVVAVGQTAQAIKNCASKFGVKVTIQSDIKQAVRQCFEIVRKTGGVVLMSNACASFDSFDGFEQRGNYFCEVVKEIKRENQKN